MMVEMVHSQSIICTSTLLEAACWTGLLDKVTFSLLLEQPVLLITYSEYNYHDILRVFSSLRNNMSEKHAGSCIQNMQ
jgi:hypothetical protein